MAACKRAVATACSFQKSNGNGSFDMAWTRKLGIIGIDIDSPSFFFPSLLSPYVSFFVVFYRLCD